MNPGKISGNRAFDDELRRQWFRHRPDRWITNSSMDGYEESTERAQTRPDEARRTGLSGVH